MSIPSPRGPGPSSTKQGTPAPLRALGISVIMDPPIHLMRAMNPLPRITHRHMHTRVCKDIIYLQTRRLQTRSSHPHVMIPDLIQPKGPSTLALRFYQQLNQASMPSLSPHPLQLMNRCVSHWSPNICKIANTKTNFLSGVPQTEIESYIKYGY